MYAPETVMSLELEMSSFAYIGELCPFLKVGEVTRYGQRRKARGLGSALGQPHLSCQWRLEGSKRHSRRDGS